MENDGKFSHDDPDFDGGTEIERGSQQADSIDPENMTADQLRANINAKIANPLAGFSHAQCQYTLLAIN